jgi:hypothetical protein
MAHLKRRTWVALGVLVSLWSLILGAAAWVTQPQRSAAPTCMPTPVSPQRLQAHVRALSETLHPRDHAHPENLERLVARVKRGMRSAGGIPVESLSAPRSVVGVDLSDHASFWDVGYPAAMVTDTAFLRNPSYHQPGDTWDTLDYARMAKVVEAVYCAVESLAKKPL